jgi:Flp pilus assembly protein TadD
MSVFRILVLLSFGLLTACQNAGGLTSRNIARNAPLGADPGGTGVDGLIVGHRLMASGEYELALKAYLRAASEQGMNVDVLSALGSANLQLGRLGQAETLLRRATDLDPTFVPALNNLGVVLMERGKSGEAKLVFQQAFAQDSGETDSIRENLRRAIAESENPEYTQTDEPVLYDLMRRGDEGIETLNSL